ncbi:MAG: hypothetical protein LUC85_08635 [Bacteroidales bacterium]|nr:hypothetical protein [Bacteroidales bacterium]
MEQEKYTTTHMAFSSANCIPSDIFEMGLDDYDRFLTERRQLMAAKIRSYYESL